MESIMTFFSTTPYWDPAMIAVLIAVGAFVGFVNTVAGLATVISYSLFMFMGMPINIANATSRVGVLLQFSANSMIFRKEGILDVSLATKVGIPVALGALLGAEMAAVFRTDVIEIVTGIVLPLIASLLFVDKKKFSEKYHISAQPEMSPLKYIIFFIIGIYGGLRARYRGLARILLCLFTRLLMQKKEHIHSGVCSLPYCQPIILLVSWQCFFHYHLAAYIFCSIQFVDCLLGFSSFGHLYEGKTF